MKIKEVCEKTNLTDKTIRYYIRAGLVFPKFDENYTGRKNFNFEDSDIERLNQIAILRKYGFSVNNIRDLIDKKADIKDIFNKHLIKMQSEAECSERILKRLKEISGFEFSNMAELCNLFSSSEYIPQNVPSVDDKSPYKLMYKKNKNAKNILIILIVLTVALSSIVIGFVCKSFYYATSSSVININKGFIGIRVIETDNKSYGADGTENFYDIYIVDSENIEYSDAFSDVSLTEENGVLVINASISSDKAYIKICPIYESKNYDVVYYNTSYWVCPEDSPNLKSKFIMKSKISKYKYNIQIN